MLMRGHLTRHTKNSRPVVLISYVYTVDRVAFFRDRINELRLPALTQEQIVALIQEYVHLSPSPRYSLHFSPFLPVPQLLTTHAGSLANTTMSWLP